MNVKDRSDNPYRTGTTPHKLWERAKREGFDITEKQIEFCTGIDIVDYHPPVRIA